MAGTVPSSKDDIDIQIGGTYFRINWNVTNGWESTYVVYYQRARKRRFERSLNSVSFKRPPGMVLVLE